MRTGLGYDLHRLVRGKRLMMGGVHIPFKKGEKAHSDGDVLLHAITDALLGACGMGDIGEFFPPSDKKWKDANSSELLSTVWEIISEAGWKIQNIDCVIIIEEPKILPFRKEQIFIKAKTGEGIGIIGKGKAVAALASCLIFCRHTQE